MRGMRVVISTAVALAVIFSAAEAQPGKGGGTAAKGGKAQGLGQSNVKGGKAQGLGGQPAAIPTVAAQAVPMRQAVPVQQQQQQFAPVQQPMVQQQQPGVQYVAVQQQQQQQPGVQYVPVQQQQQQPGVQYVPVQQQQQQPLVQQPLVQQPAAVAQPQRTAAPNTAQRTRGPARAKPCNNKPCKNDAVCTNVRSKSGNPYTCVCKKGWEGDTCEEKQMSLHLNADLVYKGEDGEQVRQSAMVDGVVQPDFSEEGQVRYAVSQDTVRVTLTNTGELPLDFKQPALIAEHPDVISPALVGAARKGGRLGRADDKGGKDSGKGKKMKATKDLSIRHNCVIPGKSSKVMLVLQFQSGNVTLGWTVQCPKAATTGLTIVMKGMEDKVYTGGNVNPNFSPTANTLYRAEVSKNVTSFILFACDPKEVRSKGKGGKKGCPHPISMNRPKVVSDDLRAASPVVIGQAAKGGTVDLATEVAVKHNCHNFGTPRITLTLNFKSYDPITLHWEVSCGGGKPTGLTITQSQGPAAPEIVANGEVKSEWARDESVTVIGGDAKFTAFRIFSTNKKTKMTFEQAQITASNDNCNPGLSGQYWKGGSVGFKGGVNRLKNLNTKKKGMKKVVEKVTGKKYDKDTHSKNNKDKQKQAQHGEGFDKTDGARRQLELSQLDSHERLWGAADASEEQEFGIVVAEQGIYSDRRRAAQGIVGGMDDFADMAGSESIVVTYNCVAKGSSIITLSIPFVMYDTIEIQWTKQCDGGSREFFTVRAMEQLVVEDGVAMDHWHPLYTKDFGQIIDSGDTETTFQIQMAENPKAMADAGPAEDNYLDEWVDMFVEDTYTSVGQAVSHATSLVQTFGRPRISSDNKRVCRPSLAGTARSGGTATATPQDLTAKFHCLDKGEAVITITIPVGIYLDVVYSFVKRCNRDPVKGFIMVPKGQSKRVITNGIAEKAYRAEAVGGYVNIEGMEVYPRANKTATFTATMSRSVGGITYLEPMIRSHPPICDPHFDGDMAHGGVLSPVRSSCALDPSSPNALPFPLFFARAPCLSSFSFSFSVSFLFRLCFRIVASCDIQL